MKSDFNRCDICGDISCPYVLEIHECYDFVKKEPQWKNMSYNKYIENILDTCWSEYDLFSW